MTETSIRSGVDWIDALFDLCVRILMWLAHLFGVSYNEINIWVFCVLWPVFTIALISIVLFQWKKIRRLKQKLAQK